VGAVIRRLKPGDETRAGEVAATFKAAQFPPPRARRFLADRANYLIVAESAGELAGFVLAYRLQRLDRAAAQLFVYEVGVAPQHRHGGIGTSLMAYVRDLVAEESLMEAFVLTDQSNDAAMHLYRSTGGQVEGAGSVLFVYPGHAASYHASSSSPAT
jgi:aminoglycoside 3-N-acetyltransferase I